MEELALPLLLWPGLPVHPLYRTYNVAFWLLSSHVASSLRVRSCPSSGSKGTAGDLVQGSIFCRSAIIPGETGYLIQKSRWRKCTTQHFN